MFKLLYKAGKSEKEFSRLDFVEKPKKENDEISPFFQENLKNIFPELIFVFKENRKETTRYKFSKGRELDAICWYPKGRFFIIFEYKSRKSRGKTDQIVEYLDCFSDKNNEDCVNLFDDLKKSLPESEEILRKNIEWEDLRLIWISPEEIPPPSSILSKIPDIIWVENEWYKKNNEIAIRLESEDRENLLEKLSRKEKIEPVKSKIENLSQLLQKTKGVDKKIEEWSEKFHKIATKKFLLTFKFYYQPKDYWYNGKVTYYYTEDKREKRLFWLTIGKSLRIYFSPKISKEVIIVKNEEILSESLSIIKEVLKKQANKNE